MSLAFRLSCFTSPPNLTHQRISVRPKTPSHFPPPKLTTLPTIRAVQENSEHFAVSPAKPRWENILSTAASLYPFYVTAGGVVACLKPSAFSWFVERGPASYSLSLGLIMLSMGLTLEYKDLLGLFRQRPLSILFGCVAQYTIMPLFATLVAKIFGLPPSLSVGLILLGCCPGGTASNVATLIAQGDVPLSIVMTVCTTLGAVALTPLLTKILAGTYVPVDAAKLSISTMQTMLSGEVGVVILSVLLVHIAGFFVGYISAAVCGFREAQRRAISIEVGMQNSSLGVVLATSHFTSPMVALPAALSAVIMNIMGSSLAFFWRYVDPSDSKETPTVDLK